MSASVQLKHYGKIINGKKVYYNSQLHQETINELEGCEFEEVIKERHKRVSEDAFGYYYGGVIGEALKYEMFGGWDKDDLDEELKKRFLSYNKTLCIKYDNGSEEFITQRKMMAKRNISKKDMKAFTDRCIEWMAEKGIVIQPSDQYLLGQYKTEIKHVK